MQRNIESYYILYFLFHCPQFSKSFHVCLLCFEKYKNTLPTFLRHINTLIEFLLKINIRKSFKYLNITYFSVYSYFKEFIKNGEKKKVLNVES